MVDWENATGILALAMTVVYVAMSYPREIIATYRGKARMTISFQLAATAVFLCWTVHSLCSSPPNWIILVPNAIGTFAAGILTTTLIWRRGAPYISTSLRAPEPRIVAPPSSSSHQATSE